MKNHGTEWRRRIKAGELIIGGHIFLPNPAMAEAMALFGYQYIWIDGEHCAFDRRDIFAHITAINGAGAGAVVRVTANDPDLIKPVLDMGPNGIVVPMVNTAEQAAAFVSACTYPPKGIRGFGPKRANLYGTISAKEYLETIDESLIKIAQIEHRDGVENIDSILEVPGLDAIVVGPFDLSASMNLIGQVMHPDMQAACRRIVERCKAHKIPCGPSLGVGNEEAVKFWMELKPDFVFYGDDIAFAKMGATASIAKIKEFSPQ